MKQIIDAIATTLFAIKHPPLESVAETRQHVTAYYDILHLGNVVVHFHDLAITPCEPTVTHVEFRASVHQEYSPKNPASETTRVNNGMFNIDISGADDTYEALTAASYQIFKKIVDTIRENADSPKETKHNERN